MTTPDTTLRAVEFRATVARISRLADGAASLGLRSELEFSKAEFWPLQLLQGEPCDILVTPDNIGADADAEPVKPEGKRGGSASQMQRLVIEAIGTARGIEDAGKLEAYYQSRMQSNINRLTAELDKVQNER